MQSFKLERKFDSWAICLLVKRFYVVRYILSKLVACVVGHSLSIFFILKSSLMNYVKVLTDQDHTEWRISYRRFEIWYVHLEVKKDCRPKRCWFDHVHRRGMISTMIYVLLISFPLKWVLGSSAILLVHCNDENSLRIWNIHRRKSICRRIISAKIKSSRWRSFLDVYQNKISLISSIETESERTQRRYKRSRVWRSSLLRLSVSLDDDWFIVRCNTSFAFSFDNLINHMICFGRNVSSDFFLSYDVLWLFLESELTNDPDYLTRCCHGGSQHEGHWVVMMIFYPIYKCYEANDSGLISNICLHFDYVW